MDFQTTATGAPVPQTTTASSHHILTNVFCQQADVIMCQHNFDIVCGSDGILYPNKYVA